MNTSLKRNLVALAVALVMASPMAFAKGVPNGHAAGPATGSMPSNDSGNAMDRGHSVDTMGAANTSDTHQNMSTMAKSPPGQGSNWWTSADTNGDGKISTAEATANAGLSSRFGIIDTNKDGFVTMDEYRSFYTSTASQGEQHAAGNSEVVTRDIWSRLDADADGKLSASEVSGDLKLNDSFSAMDSNNDGFVSQDEYRAYARTHH